VCFARCWSCSAKLTRWEVHTSKRRIVGRGTSCCVNWEESNPTLEETLPAFGLPDDQNRPLFLDTLAEACGKADWHVHAWCLMTTISIW
jgi:hypothetical protein